MPFSEHLGTGALPGRIGERKTVGDISLGMIIIEPTPGPLVANAFAAELRAAGHKVVDSGAAATLRGEIQRFTLRTDVTAVYWDVVVDTSVATVATKGAASSTGHYNAHCTDRTYIYPSAQVITGVVNTCVADLAHQFRDDADARRVLAGP